MKNPLTSRLAVAAFALAVLAGCASANLISQSKEKPPMTQQKQQVVALLKAIETGDPAPVAVINPSKYIQHNLSAADGLAGFGALLQALPKGSAKVNTVRVFQDGDFVFAHTDYNFFGAK